jgi:hypothetical protein
VIRLQAPRIDGTQIGFTIPFPTHPRDTVEGESGYGKMTPKKGQPNRENQPNFGVIKKETGNKPVSKEREVA